MDSNIDYLDNEEANFSIEEIPCKRIINEFVDGSSERQFKFILATRLFYNTYENKQRIKNIHLFEKIENWLEEKVL